MGWNIGMAVIENAPISHVVATLGLVAPPAGADVRPQLPLGDAIDHRDAFWGVGALGNFTIVTAKAVADHQALWELISRDHRVLVFYLTEVQGENCLYIYEHGERVVRREEKKGSRAWKPSHVLERRTRTKHKTDYIADVFKNMTGMKLVESMDMVVDMRVMPPPESESIDEVRARFDKQLAEPQQPDHAWASLIWINRWIALHRCLDEAWDRDPGQVVETWIPRVLDDMATWPEDRRELAWERFDTIAKGRDDGRYTEFAPLYRKFMLRHDNNKTTWRAKPFAKFFEHPIASALTILDCGHTSMPPALGGLIASSPRLERVRDLSFDRSRLTNEGVIAFARATRLASLRALNLYACGMDRTALPALLDAAFAPQLERIELGQNGIGADVALLRGFPNLRALGLWCESSVDEGSLHALLESDALPVLETLDLRQWPHDPAPLRKIRPSLTILHEPPISL